MCAQITVSFFRDIDPREEQEVRLYRELSVCVSVVRGAVSSLMHKR